MHARIRFAALLAAALLAPLAAQAASTRTHVSNAGSDANTAFSCDYAHPCRTFAAALTQTTSGGEILAIDSSGYGKVVIDRSVSIVAAPGVFAGIGVGAGGNATGVEIATADVKVALRGLTITGQGGDYGIHMTGGASLLVERCAVSGFSGAGGGAITVSTPASVNIADSVVHDNYGGIHLGSGATGSISSSRVLNNLNRGIRVDSDSVGVTTSISVSDTVVSGTLYYVGIHATASAGTARVAVSRATVSGNVYGVASGATVAGISTTIVDLANSTVTGNNTGLYAGGAGTTHFRVNGTNLVHDNGTNETGTITTIAAR